MSKPRKYQLQDIEKIKHFHGRALLANEQRTGKTLEALWTAKLFPEARPIVVVCQKTPKWEWVRQSVEHIGIRGVVLKGTKIPKTNPIKNPEL